VVGFIQVKRYDAYDGAPFSEENSAGAVRYLDLSVPQLWLPRYDWVVCLEVVEHVPPEFESVVLDNIIRYSSPLLLISVLFGLLLDSIYVTLIYFLVSRLCFL